MTEGGRHAEREVAPRQAEERALYTSDGSLNPDVVSSVTRERERGRTWRTGIIALCIPATVAATGLPAWLVAGTVTTVNISVAAGMTLVATISGGGGLWWGRHQHRRASEARQRVVELEGRLGVMTEERDSLRRRTEGLERDLNRLRDERDRQRELPAKQPGTGRRQGRAREGQ
jgi:hypothetical protein